MATLAAVLAGSSVCALRTGGITLAYAADTADVPDVKVTDAWIRWLPAGVPAGGYMTLANTGATRRQIVGASSDAYDAISFHQTVMEHGMSGMPGMPGMSGMSGMSTMKALDSIVLEPHATVRFEEGGYHLMLMRPKRALHAGDRVQILLTFSDGRTLTVPFAVRTGE